MNSRELCLLSGQRLKMAGNQVSHIVGVLQSSGVASLSVWAGVLTVWVTGIFSVEGPVETGGSLV